MNMGVNQKSETPKPVQERIEMNGRVLVKQKTLNDFTPREIIKHLYDLGYRIENNKLYVVTRREVKLSDVCNFTTKNG